MASLIADEFRERDKEISALILCAHELEAKVAEMTAVNQQVDEIIKRVDAKQAARDESKRGKMGPQGQRGARGERGLPGRRGPAGRSAASQPTIIAFKNSKNSYQIISYLSNGQPKPVINLFPLLQRMLNETAGYYG